MTLACLLALTLPGLSRSRDAGGSGADRDVRGPPGLGPAPLAVSFLLNMPAPRAPTTVSISYGDGSRERTRTRRTATRPAAATTRAFDIRTADPERALHGRGDGQRNRGAFRSGNQPPNAVFKTTPGGVGAGSRDGAPHVLFNMCASSDPEATSSTSWWTSTATRSSTSAASRASTAARTSATRSGTRSRSCASTTATRAARRCTTTSARRTPSKRPRRRRGHGDTGPRGLRSRAGSASRSRSSGCDLHP